MAQSDFGTINPATKSGAQLSTDLNSWRDAVHSSHKGSTAPTYKAAGMFWLDDTTAATHLLKYYDGTDWITVLSMDTDNNRASIVTIPERLSFPLAGGTANALTLAPAVALTAYFDLDVVTFEAAFNNTDPVTLAVSGLGTKALRKIVAGTDVALSPGDILDGGRYLLSYDAAANSSAGAFILVNPSKLTDLNGGPLGGQRNKLIDGDGRINQLGTSTAADDAYGHDQHIALTQTGAIGISTVTAPANGIASMMRLTQSQATAQRFGYAQIVEASETYALRGKVVTLGGKLRYSNAAPIRYAILEWTGAADAVTSDVVNNWASTNYTAGNFFNSTTLTVRQVGTITPSAAVIADWSLTATIGATANNIIVFYWTEGTAAQNSTLDQRWYLVEGDATGEADPFSSRNIQQELDLCRRFCRISGALQGASTTSTTQFSVANPAFNAGMRVSQPAVTVMIATNAIVEPGVAFISIGSPTSIIHNIDLPCSPAFSGAFRPGILSAGALLFDARL